MYLYLRGGVVGSYSRVLGSPLQFSSVAAPPQAQQALWLARLFRLVPGALLALVHEFDVSQSAEGSVDLRVF